MNILVYTCIYSSKPSTLSRIKHKVIFKQVSTGLSSEFSFFWTKVKERTLSYYLTLAEEEEHLDSYFSQTMWLEKQSLLGFELE